MEKYDDIVGRMMSQAGTHAVDQSKIDQLAITPFSEWYKVDSYNGFTRADFAI